MTEPIMDERRKNAIEEYQCPGCVCGSNIECFEEDEDSLRCSKHCAGTNLYPGGRIFLGLPTGFNKVGPCGNELRIQIFSTFNDVCNFDYLNVPVWKYLNKQGNTLIKGISPRIMFPFLFIVLENCIEKVECFELTEKDLCEMD